MSLNPTSDAVPFSTPDAAAFGIFLHSYKDRDGINRYRPDCQEGDPDEYELGLLRDVIDNVLNPPKRHLTVVSAGPSESVWVSREIVAGVEVSRYNSAVDGPTVALETDEVVHVEHLPELIKHLKSIHEDHRFSEARSYFASEDAIDLKDFTLKSLADFAESNGFDGPAFMTVAAEVMSR
ncbi:hypothetical protein [Galactobacter valiniphilus]|uniref:hypothetical protein n=1 Tax=Galactobacter valiniphilus TaxID=2676122 RepID=UPI0037366277